VLLEGIGERIDCLPVGEHAQLDGADRKSSKQASICSRRKAMRGGGLEASA
jgi:hypothetical protein